MTLVFSIVLFVIAVGLLVLGMDQAYKRRAVVSVVAIVVSLELITAALMLFNPNDMARLVQKMFLPSLLAAGVLSLFFGFLPRERRT